MPLQRTYNPRLAESVWWNLLLLTIGSGFYAMGIQTVAIPHNFVAGGVMGISMLSWYFTDFLTVPIWYFTISIPIFIFGWFCVGRVFLLYSLYGAVVTTVWGSLFTFTIPVDNQFYAAVFASVLTGTGSGIMLRSFGSAGGTDIIAVAMRERWNISVGTFSFTFNLVVFSLASIRLDLDLIIASAIMLFMNSTVLEYMLRVFSHRKTVFIITDRGEAMCEAINVMRQFGVTLVRGKGAYSGKDKEVLITVTSNVFLKQLENIVFSIDEKALFIVENTFYVSGGQFARKVYK